MIRANIKRRAQEDKEKRAQEEKEETEESEEEKSEEELSEEEESAEEEEEEEEEIPVRSKTSVRKSRAARCVVTSDEESDTERDIHTARKRLIQSLS